MNIFPGGPFGDLLGDALGDLLGVALGDLLGAALALGDALVDALGVAFGDVVEDVFVVAAALPLDGHVMLSVGSTGVGRTVVRRGRPFPCPASVLRCTAAFWPQ